jgi:hypothetical protein
MAAHPPGPGFPWHPPSVKMVTFFKPDNHSNPQGIRQPDSHGKFPKLFPVHPDNPEILSKFFNRRTADRKLRARTEAANL